MSAARNSFYETMTVIRGLPSHALLTDVLPLTEPQNNRARIIRSGLIVSTFAHLEAYIAERLEEVLQTLPSSSIAYSSFDDRLRRFFSIEAIYGLRRRVGFMQGTDDLAFAEMHLPRLAGFSLTPPSFTGLGFSPNSSNVNPGDIANLLRAFGIKDVWRKLAAICTQIGISRISVEDDFKNLLRTRNRAAHDSATNVPTGDLTSLIGAAILIGMSVDIAVSYAIECYVRSATFRRAVSAADRLDVRLRFLDEGPAGTWRERARSGGRTIRVHADFNTAYAAAVKPSVGIIVRDARLFPLRIS